MADRPDEGGLCVRQRTPKSTPLSQLASVVASFGSATCPAARFASTWTSQGGKPTNRKAAVTLRRDEWDEPIATSSVNRPLLRKHEFRTLVEEIFPQLRISSLDDEEIRWQLDFFHQRGVVYPPTDWITNAVSPDAYPVIVDQRWIIEGIYELIRSGNRSRDELMQCRGRVTRTDLWTAWDDLQQQQQQQQQGRTYNEEARLAMLAYMESSGWMIVQDHDEWLDHIRFFILPDAEWILSRNDTDEVRKWKDHWRTKGASHFLKMSEQFDGDEQAQVEGPKHYAYDAWMRFVAHGSKYPQRIRAAICSSRSRWLLKSLPTDLAGNDLRNWGLDEISNSVSELPKTVLAMVRALEPTQQIHRLVGKAVLHFHAGRVAEACVVVDRCLWLMPDWERIHSELLDGESVINNEELQPLTPILPDWRKRQAAGVGARFRLRMRLAVKRKWRRTNPT